jgi:hypothetical protein
VNLGDLLGLLFLVFFVILPALQGFLRRSQDLPRDFEPDQIPLPGQQSKPQKPPSPTSPSRPQQTPSQTGKPPPRPLQTPQRSAAKPAPPSPRPLVSEPARPTPKPGGKTLEELERERLVRKTQPPAQSRPAAPPSPVPAEQKPTFSTDPRAILNGVVWAQVLNEPRGKYWRRTRKPKP